MTQNEKRILLTESELFELFKIVANDFEIWHKGEVVTIHRNHISKLTSRNMDGSQTFRPLSKDEELTYKEAIVKHALSKIDNKGSD